MTERTTENTFFTSDLHFWHRNIRNYCPTRPGETIEEMNEIIIENWNSIIGPHDHGFILGDFAMTSRKDLLEPILKRLNGFKYLVKGNHDLGTYKKAWFSDYFEWIRDYYVLYLKDPDARRGQQMIVMSHFPFLVWDKGHKGSWMLHGHSHGSCDPRNKKVTRFDVGVDGPLSNYLPYSYKQLKEIFKNKEYLAVDNHGANKKEAINK